MKYIIISEIILKKVSYDKNGNIYPYEIIQLSHDECVLNFIEDFDNELTRKKIGNVFYNIIKI